MSWFREVYGRYLLFFDFLAGTIVALLVIAAVHLGQSRPSLSGTLSGNRLSAYVGIASVSGALLGFIITTITVNLVFVQLPQMRLLRKSGRAKDILDINFHAIRWLAISTAWSFIGLLADSDRHPRILLSYLTMWVVGVTTVRVYRCIWILRRFSKIAVKALSNTQVADSTS